MKFIIKLSIFGSVILFPYVTKDFTGGPIVLTIIHAILIFIFMILFIPSKSDKNVSTNIVAENTNSVNNNPCPYNSPSFEIIDEEKLLNIKKELNVMETEYIEHKKRINKINRLINEDKEFLEKIKNTDERLLAILSSYNLRSIILCIDDLFNLNEKLKADYDNMLITTDEYENKINLLNIAYNKLFDLFEIVTKNSKEIKRNKDFIEKIIKGYPFSFSLWYSRSADSKIELNDIKTTYNKLIEIFDFIKSINLIDKNPFTNLTPNIKRINNNLKIKESEDILKVINDALNEINKLN